ncbi:MAG TPA: DUF1761 domain-containing protein [Patescibacteria group bacterium]|jgi:hypothetical protein|nr:DUF1761 domain-containing protein [Patescibacteria group bacterium]
MNINYVAVLVAAVAQFIFGAIWYMPIFGKLWGKIHGFDKVPQDQQKDMMKKIPPLLIAQFIFTIITTVILAILRNVVSTDWSIYNLAFHLWLGFMVPTQVSAVIFGGTDPKWFIQKILIMAFGALGCMLIAGFVLQAF